MGVHACIVSGGVGGGSVLNDFFGLHVQTILHYKILELYAVCVRVQYLLSLVSGLWWDVGWVGC